MMEAYICVTCGTQYAPSTSGLAAIAISHPHFYSAMVDWSRAFGNIPIYTGDA